MMFRASLCCPGPQDRAARKPLSWCVESTWSGGKPPHAKPKRNQQNTCGPAHRTPLLDATKHAPGFKTKTRRRRAGTRAPRTRGCRSCCSDTSTQSGPTPAASWASTPSARPTTSCHTSSRRARARAAGPGSSLLGPRASLGLRLLGVEEGSARLAGGWRAHQDQVHCRGGIHGGSDCPPTERLPLNAHPPARWRSASVPP
jgi:hypothetical protein